MYVRYTSNKTSQETVLDIRHHRLLTEHIDMDIGHMYLRQTHRDTDTHINTSDVRIFKIWNRIK